MPEHLDVPRRLDAGLVTPTGGKAASQPPVATGCSSPGGKLVVRVKAIARPADAGCSRADATEAA